MQLAALRGYSQRHDWIVTSEYVDLGVSGYKESSPDLNRIMKDASIKFREIVISALGAGLLWQLCLIAAGMFTHRYTKTNTSPQ
jgi:hypothetical protein